MKLENKVALITGATSGIGKATAKAFVLQELKWFSQDDAKCEGKATEAQLQDAGVDC